MVKLEKRGAALAWTVIIMAVLSVLGITVLSISMNDTKQVMRQQKRIQSFYVARGGADALASYFIDNVRDEDQYDDIADNMTATLVPNGSLAGADQSFDLNITGDFKEFVIESVAYDNEDQETARVYLSIIEQNLLDFAIFANGNLEAGQNIFVSGDVGTNLDSIDYGNNPISGSVTLGPDATPEQIEEAAANSTEDPRQLTSPMDFPDIDEALFTDDWSPGFSEVWDDWTTYEYDISGDEHLTIDEIYLSGGTDDFIVTGSGNLHLFVEDEIYCGGEKYIGTEGDAKLFIYYNGTDTVKFNGKLGSHIYLYAPNAEVIFAGGGSGNFNGSIICDEFSGPDSNVPFVHDEGLSMEDLLVDQSQVAGYKRHVWLDQNLMS